MLCRICSSMELIPFLDLGFTPPADDFLSSDRLHLPETYYPLEVMVCKDCGLIQLSYVVPPEKLYQNEYPYESSTTRTGREHYYSFAAEVVDQYQLTGKDLVIDIGSNVGVLLSGFKEKDVRVLGIEPAKDVCEIANQNGIDTINQFFSSSLAKDLVKTCGKAKVITGTNVIAHIDKLNDLIEGLDILLDKKGIFVFEAPYLVRLLEHLEYDTIYHEHLSYLSVYPIKRLLKNYGMELINLEEKSIHGGTLRYYIARMNDYPVKKVVQEYLNLEVEKKIYDIDNLMNFAESVENHREKIVWMLKKLKNDGKSIAAVSAPAKGMTLLNYCKIGRETLDFITEKSRLKIGKFTPGTHIPVVSDDYLLQKMPDYALLLAWNFADEIMANLHEYKERGGKFIIPIPEPRIIQ